MDAKSHIPKRMAAQALVSRRRQRWFVAVTAAMVVGFCIFVADRGWHILIRTAGFQRLHGAFHGRFLSTPSVPVQAIKRTIAERIAQWSFDEAILEPSANRIGDDSLIDTITYLDDRHRLVTVVAVVNAEGFRGPEVSIKVPPGIIRIAVVGDSHVYGWGLADNDTFCAQLEQRLGVGFQVLNFGIPGANLLQKLDLLQGLALSYQPAIVILQLQHNFQGDDYIPKAMSLWRMKLHRELLNQYVLRVEEHGLLVSRLLHPAVEQAIEQFGLRRVRQKMIEQPLLQAIEMSERHGFQLIVLASDDFSDKPTAWVRRTLTEHRIPYLGVLQDVFGGARHPISAFEPHYNRRGHFLIAERLSHVIAQPGESAQE